jgi:hypothetical protein
LFVVAKLVLKADQSSGIRNVCSSELFRAKRSPFPIVVFAQEQIRSLVCVTLFVVGLRVFDFEKQF